MRRGTAAAIAASALQLCVACGGRTGIGASDAGDWAGNDAAGALDALWDGVRRVPECGQPSLVPAGTTYVGAWDYDGGVFAPSTQCGVVNGLDRMGNKKVSVGAFLLMSEPVTNACYAQCVNAGACKVPLHDNADPDPRSWSDSDRREQPAYMDYNSAETFCSWAGGYVPDLAQLLRASQGDASKPGVAAMTDAVATCHEHADASPLCGQIATMDFSGPFGTSARNALYPVGGVAADVGPFGHRDFGDGFEWTQTLEEFESRQFCALQDGAPDFVTSGTGQFGVVNFETTELGFFEGEVDQVFPGPDTYAYLLSYVITFRCAFGDRPKPG